MAVVGIVGVVGLLLGFLAFMMWQKEQSLPLTSAAYRRITPSELQDARQIFKRGD